MQILSDIALASYRALYPKFWPNWSPKKAKSQKLADYVSFQELLMKLHDVPDITPLLCTAAKVKFLRKARDRKTRLLKLKDQVKFPRFVFLLSTASFIVCLLVDRVTPLSDFNWWIFWSLIICVTFGIPTGKRISELRRLIRVKTMLNTSAVFKEPNQQSSHQIIKLIKALQESEIVPFVHEADGVFKSLNRNFWKADCFELGLFESHEMREAVALEGEAPSGQIYFLKSEIKRIFPEYNIANATVSAEKNLSKTVKKEEWSQPEIYPRFETEKIKLQYQLKSDIELTNRTCISYAKETTSRSTTQNDSEKYNRNSRTTIVRHPDALSSIHKIEELLKLIDIHHPKDALGKREGLSKGRKTRLRAIEYLNANPEFWAGILAGRSINHTENISHRSNLIDIFRSSARNQNTLEEPGKDLMEKFVTFKDNTLETWLAEMDWKVSVD